MGIKEMLASEWQTVQQLRHLRIEFDPDLCGGCWQCYEVCPVGCWRPDREAHLVRFNSRVDCVACGACVLQCPQDAIQLTVKKR